MLIKDKEADTVVSEVYNIWILGLNGIGFGTPSKHVYNDNGTEFTTNIGENLVQNLEFHGSTQPATPHTAMVHVKGTIGQ